MKAYVLTNAAEADLREIIRYTRAQWGEAQVRSYVARLEQGIERLVKREGAFSELAAIHPGLRMELCEHHYVFCLPREAAPALIVALLHERMDLMSRVAERLRA